MQPGPRRDFVCHILPGWISAVCAMCSIAIALYTLVLLNQTRDTVSQIMTHVDTSPPAVAAPGNSHHL